MLIHIPRWKEVACDTQLELNPRSSVTFGTYFVLLRLGHLHLPVSFSPRLMDSLPLADVWISIDAKRKGGLSIWLYSGCTAGSIVQQDFSYLRFYILDLQR